MRISCASLFLWEYSIYEIMTILLEADIYSVEFWAETPDFWLKRNDETSTVILQEAISMMPGGCTLHASVMDLNPASINERVREATMKETLWCLELANKLNARAVTIHPGRRTVKRPPMNKDREAFLSYLSACKKRADALDLDLALENSMPGVSNMCYSADEVKYVLDRFPGLYLTFDVVHAFMVSQKNALSFIEELSDRIINVHIGAPHDGKPHYPSYRTKRMEKVLIALRDSGYEGDLTIEIDDKIYPAPLSRQDKMRELREERKYLETIFDST